jgi:hypothetical protein
MTLQEFFNKFVAFMEERLKGPHAPASRAHMDALEQAGPPGLREHAQALVNEVPAAPFEPTGSCTYQVGGSTFCIAGVTQSECNSLSGSWVKNGTCPTSVDWAPGPLPGSSS